MWLAGNIVSVIEKFDQIGKWLYYSNKLNVNVQRSTSLYKKQYLYHYDKKEINCLLEGIRLSVFDIKGLLSDLYQPLTTATQTLRQYE